MHVFINGSQIFLFSGARVLDGLTAYSSVALEDVQAGNVVVLDAEGHRLYVDGRLQDGDHLILAQAEQGEDND
ncbi:MAG: hypothetical protein RB296_07110 [Acidobacteriota bacterium]|jgi:hypothetical protein|nr:hypothetical protein [Acidobacteriota bacterium]